MAEKLKLSISQILDHLKNGKDRKAIKELYGLSHADMTALFNHPKLKGKRVVPQREPSFELIDDIADEGAETAVAEEQVVATPKKGKGGSKAVIQTNAASKPTKPAEATGNNETAVAANQQEAEDDQVNTEVVDDVVESGDAISEKPTDEDTGTDTQKGVW